MNALGCGRLCVAPGRSAATADRPEMELVT